MYNVYTDNNLGILTISEEFNILDAPAFTYIGASYSQIFSGLSNISKLKTFTYSIIGNNNSRYIETSYRISRDESKWTTEYTLDENITNFPIFGESDRLFVEVKWERKGYTNIGIIKLISYNLSGTINRNVQETFTSRLNISNKTIIVKPPYIYKIFKINDLEILSSGDIDNTSIKYRYSQNYGRTVSNWTILTKDNIKSERINPIRFFQIEYLIEYSGILECKIYDINLIGDFQNVTLDSQKTNVYGSREDCNCLMLNIVGGDTNTSGNPSNMITGVSCVNNLTPLTTDDISKLFKPYQQTQAVNLLNKLSTDANALFGHQVVYFLTDPDSKGTDYSFHEYQLYNYVCEKIINVSVDQNNFPDNQIVMNQFDLSLFESFEIHIPKEDFKVAFGTEKRPSKEDFLWFCEINRMFQVEHAQQFRNFNNSSLYYKIMLKKYSQKANIIGVNQTITDKVRDLTKNSTIDELFGLENMEDKKSISNMEEFKTLTNDLLRVDVNVNINRELIENSSNIISKTNYELSSTDYLSDAVTYRNFKSYFKVSDNLSYMSWFNINNYVVGDSYNFIKYYDDVNKLGIKINLTSDVINVNFNSSTYSFPIGLTGNALALEESTWYCYVVNIDQRQRVVSQWIYKRNVDDESDADNLNSTILRNVYKIQSVMIPDEFDINGVNAVILASDMKITNIRMFIDIIPESEHNKILNQYHIGKDTKYLIFSDNANNQLILPNFSNNQSNDTLIRRGTRKDN